MKQGLMLRRMLWKYKYEISCLGHQGQSWKGVNSLSIKERTKDGEVKSETHLRTGSDRREGSQLMGTGVAANARTREAGGSLVREQ